VKENARGGGPGAKTIAMEQKGGFLQKGEPMSARSEIVNVDDDRRTLTLLFHNVMNRLVGGCNRRLVY
jgi:hypothetical protein